MKRWLEETIRVKKPVTQIYNGVDIELYSPNGSTKRRICKELGIPSVAFIIGTVGRLDPIKDHATLFRALKEVQKRISNTVLFIVGDGPERKRLESLTV